MLEMKKSEIKFAGKTYVRVFGNSMSPTLNHNQLVSVISCDTGINEGEIIVFSPRDKHMVIHRVVEKTRIDETEFFLTKGDHNKEDDGYFIPLCLVMGKVKCE